MQTLNLIVMIMLGLIIILEVIAIALLLFRKIELPESATIKSLEFAIREIKEKLLPNLPQNVLNAIKGSKAEREGHLLELLTVMSLTEYDRVFYFGSRPIDYIGIKFDSDKAGVYFIEIKKQGKKRREQLSPEERQLQKLIEERKVYYLSISASPVAVAEDITERLTTAQPAD